MEKSGQGGGIFLSRPLHEVLDLRQSPLRWGVLGWASWGSMSRVHTTGVHPQCTCGGILRGTGNQKAGAIINAVGYYVLGLPIGISLMFAAGLGLLGKPPPRAGRAGITAWEVAVRARSQILRRGFKRTEKRVTAQF